MKISIIIPSYNLGQYIKRTIESVLSQDYLNKELIVVDGGSTDNTIDILRSYGDKIFWISEEDNGQSDAINKGFKMASGEVVAWINADDYYEPNILSKVVEEFSKDTSISILYGKCKSISETETVINTPPSNITAKKLINSGNLIYQPSSFYNSVLVKKVGYLDDNLNYWMEYDLYIKLLKQNPGHFLDQVLSNFTVREDQKSNSKNQKEMEDEVLLISKRHGGGLFSKVFIKSIFNKIKNEKNN